MLKRFEILAEFVDRKVSCCIEILSCIIDYEALLLDINQDRKPMIVVMMAK